MQQTVSTLQDFRWRQRSHHYLPESLPTTGSQTLTHFIRSFHWTTARHLSHIEQIVAWVSRGPERKGDTLLVTLGPHFWEAFSRQRRVIIHAPREREPLQAPPTATEGPDGLDATRVASPRLSAKSSEAEVRTLLQHILHLCATKKLPITIQNMARCARMSRTTLRKILDAHPGLYMAEKRRFTSTHRS